MSRIIDGSISSSGDRLIDGNRQTAGTALIDGMWVSSVVFAHVGASPPGRTLRVVGWHRTLVVDD